MSQTKKMKMNEKKCCNNFLFPFLYGASSWLLDDGRCARRYEITMRFISDSFDYTFDRSPLYSLPSRCAFFSRIEVDCFFFLCFLSFAFQTIATDEMCDFSVWLPPHTAYNLRIYEVQPSMSVHTIYEKISIQKDMNHETKIIKFMRMPEVWRFLNVLRRRTV